MEIWICKPKEIKEVYLSQILNLILQGGQIRGNANDIRNLIFLADLIAYKLKDEIVICTATLKNPYPEYREKVFNLANLKLPGDHMKELGYIVTHPDYENQGHCQDLLGIFFQLIWKNSIYATTRKPSMIHILNKYGFRLEGTRYNQDLNLLIYDSPIINLERIKPGNELSDKNIYFQISNSFYIPPEFIIMN